VADTSHIVLTAINSSDTTRGHVHFFEVYSGTCDSLVLFGSAHINGHDTTITFDTTAFVPGQTYHVLVNTSGVTDCRFCGYEIVPFGFCKTSSSTSFSCNLSLLGTSSLCAGQSGSYNSCASLNCFNSYFWQIFSPSNNLIFSQVSNCNFTYTFPSCGIFTVRVCENDSINNVPNFSNCLSMFVTVQDIPTPIVASNTPLGCAGNPVCFTLIPDTCPGTFLSAFLDFGDGFTLNGPPIPPTVCHSYSLPGNYWATFSVTNQCGTNVDSLLIIVGAGSAGFVYSDSCRTICFTDTSTCPNSIVNYSWNFGDGSPISNLQNPCHTYQSSGTYSVILTITNSNGSTSTQVQQILVPQPPQKPTINGTVINTCNPGDTNNYFLTNTISGFIYTWSFSNPNNGVFIGGNTGNTVNISWANNNLGNTIIVTVFDPATNCSDTAHFTIFSCCIPAQYNCAQPSTVFNYQITNSPSNNSASALQLPSTTPDFNINFLVNGTFYIDQNYECDKCYFVMGPLAKIVVLPGKTLKLTNRTVIEAGCCYMWDGIYISDNTSTLVIGGLSTNPIIFIEDGINAIVSNAGGKYEITNVAFNNNKTGIKVNAFPGNHSGFIHNSTFSTATSPFSPTAQLLSPFPGQIAEVGVDILNVNQIQVGNPILISLQNRYNNIRLGIRSFNSSVNIYNNRFTNIISPTGIQKGTCKTGTAVCVEGTQNSSHLVKVGGAQLFERNIFNNVSYGVVAHNNLNLHIEKNAFTMNVTSPAAGIGIQISSCHNRNILIKSNNLSRFRTGIYTNFTTNSTMEISLNILENNGNPNKGTGIFCSNIDFFIIPQQGVTKILNNTIDKCQTGINTLNAGPVEVKSNNITFLPNPTNQGTYYGIRAQNTQGIIELNTIGKNGPVNSMLEPKLLGISAELSPGISIIDNKMNRMGTGIRCFGTMPFSKLQCNDMLNCYLGIFQEGSDIGQQGAPGQPSDNTWRGIVGPYDVAATILNPNFLAPAWYYRTNAQLPYYSALDFNPAPALVGSFPPNFPTTTSGPFNCNPNIICPACQRNTIINMVAEQAPYHNFSPEIRFAYKQEVFRRLHKDSSLMYQNSTGDSLLQQFYYSHQNLPVGKLEKVKKHLATNQYGQASTENQSVNSSLTPENDQKSVNDIYLNSIAQNHFDYTSPQESTLWEIAQKNPIIAGKAVYDARAMLGINFDDNVQGEGNRMASEELKSETLSQIKLYPNPAQDNIYFEILLNTSNLGRTLSVYNHAGQLIETVPIPETGLLILNTEKYPQGMYLYQIAEVDTIQCGKFIISR
jgi:PKD repeat protein